MKLYKFTDGFSTIELETTSLIKAIEMVPLRYRLLTITKSGLVGSFI